MATQITTRYAIGPLTDEDRAEAATRAQEWLKRRPASYQIEDGAKYRRALVDAFIWPTGLFQMNKSAFGKEIERCELRQLADILSPKDLTAGGQLPEPRAKVNPDANFDAHIDANSPIALYA